MHAAAVEFDLRIPGCRSLKEKRGHIKPIVEGARHRFHVASAEVGGLDQLQRSRIAIAAVAATAAHLEQILDAVDRFVWSFPNVDVVSSDRTFLEMDA